MKIYAWFFIIISLSEIIFSLGYLLLQRQWDDILLWGFLVYLIVMLSGFVSYKIAVYKRKKKDLLDGLP